ncbi:MAG: PAS domain-containing sensor histidine kinase [Methylococcales bacterium]|nr:PAS domain-containing sensor histidine kinase [Methylococcales bacterium]
MPTQSPVEKTLLAENAELRMQLNEAEETLRAIHSGEVDALVVKTSAGPRIFTLQGLDAESNRFRGEILSQISDAVIVVDDNECVTYLNAAAERQYGVIASEVLGNGLSEIYESRWPNPGDEVSAMTTLHACGEWHGEYVHIKRNGEAIQVESSMTRLNSGKGTHPGLLTVIRDITERKCLDQMLRDKYTELESAKSMAEEANLAKSQFLSRMSHELRSPLNAILGFAQLLEAGSPPPTAAQNERLQQIIKAGWYLLELINQILDLAVIESGKLSLSQEPILLTEVLNECQAMIESQAQQRDIKLTFLPIDNTWVVYADRTRVKQALINLLSNAIKYNCEHETVEVKCTVSTPKRIRISIKDHGAGLPPEKLAQLFQPFNRLGQETGAQEGTGIGLVVTKQLVELMGGAIGVESTVGVGCEFWIELIRDFTPQRAAENTMPA